MRITYVHRLIKIFEITKPFYRFKYPIVEILYDSKYSIIVFWTPSLRRWSNVSTFSPMDGYALTTSRGFRNGCFWREQMYPPRLHLWFLPRWRRARFLGAVSFHPTATVEERVFELRWRFEAKLTESGAKWTRRSPGPLEGSVNQRPIVGLIGNSVWNQTGQTINRKRYASDGISFTQFESIPLE